MCSCRLGGAIEVSPTLNIYSEHEWRVRGPIGALLFKDTQRLQPVMVPARLRCRFLYPEEAALTQPLLTTRWISSRRLQRAGFLESRANHFRCSASMGRRTEMICRLGRAEVLSRDFLLMQPSHLTEVRAKWTLVERPLVAGVGNGLRYCCVKPKVSPATRQRVSRFF